MSVHIFESDTFRAHSVAVDGHCDIFYLNRDPAMTSETSESKLIPVLRDGVNVIKMVFFLELKRHLAKAYPDWQPDEVKLLSGAVLNDLFGTPNDRDPYAGFCAAHDTTIRKELKTIAKTFENLRIPLTDALRIQFLCDDLEGIQSPAILEKARDMGILIADRQIPLPRTFMELARKLGVAYKVLAPEAVPEGEDGDGNR